MSKNQQIMIGTSTILYTSMADIREPCGKVAFFKAKEGGAGPEEC